MTLRTVRVPAEIEELFEEAEKTVSSYFGRRHDDPTRGRIEIFGERYVLVRAASLSVEFFALVRELYGAGREEEANDFARNILFDLAHALGRSDAQRFHKRMSVDDPIARLAAGPVHFAHSGWAFVDIHAESKPAPDESYYMQFDHPYSFEAEAWLEADESADFPVCIMSAGYSSGWCEESFGIPLVSSEVLCRARGDEACRFIMAQPHRIEEFVAHYAEGAPHLASKIRGFQIPDFFARKRVEEELRQARDELEERVQERTAELQHANERLREEMAGREKAEQELIRKHKLEALGRLAGGIAHDFNNLMTVVIGQSRYLEGKLKGDDPTRDQITEIRRAGERASSIAQQLLVFSRSQTTQPTLLNLDAIVRETLRMLDRIIGEDLELSVQLASSPAGILADRSQLTQVLLNLVVNARDAMAEGGVIQIETARIQEALDPADRQLEPERWVRLSVTDSGTGMDDETLHKVFDPFFSTKEEGKGTGLGLSTVYGIVQASGGRIQVHTPKEGGSRFDVYFPFAEELKEEAGASETNDVLPTGTETILVVEDQAAPRELVVRILSDLGYRVLDAGTGDEALLMFEEHPEVDLLLTDVVMPRMNGAQLAGLLVGEGKIPRLLYMSGYADEGVLEKAMGKFSADMLSKPFTPLELAQRVRRVLDE